MASTSPEKKAAAAQKKRERERKKNKSTVLKRKQLDRAIKRYHKVTASLEEQKGIFEEIMVFCEERIQALNVRVNVLSEEYNQLDTTCQYLKQAFGETKEGTPAHLLQQEVEIDRRSTYRDMQKANVRQSYYIQREQFAKNSKEEVELTLKEEKDKYLQLSQKLEAFQGTPGKVQRGNAGGDVPESSLPPSSDSARYAALPQLAAARRRRAGEDQRESSLPPSSPPPHYTAQRQLALVRRKRARRNEPESPLLPSSDPAHFFATALNDDEGDEPDCQMELDSDGQCPLPQASWDSPEDALSDDGEKEN